MKHRVTAALLLSILFGFGIFACFRAPDAVSAVERRRLAQPPALTLSALLSGRFAKALDKAAPDQFPFREAFRRAAALTRLCIFMQGDTNGVALHRGGLYQLKYDINPASVRKAAAWIAGVADTLPAGTQAYYAVIPDKNEYLPQGTIPRADEAALRAILRETLGDRVKEIELTDCLQPHAYYKTDIHWRQERLERAADRLLAEMGQSVRFTDTAYRYAEYTPFYGVLYGQAALPLRWETLVVLESAHTDAATLWNLETNKTGPVYDPADLFSMDPYDVYLSGPSALLVLTNPLAESEAALVLFRDSFGSSLAPLLLPAYRSITLVDPRYFAGAALSDYVEWRGQDVLFLFSALVLSSGDLFR